MTRPADLVCGVVLSGGKSTRMQTDKARLEIDGETLLDRARSLLRAAGCDPVLVSGRADLPDGFPDSHPGGGPAHAILDAAEAMPDTCRGLMLIPVDMPGLAVADLAPLMETRESRATHWAGFQLPLYLDAGFARPGREEVWSIKRLLAPQSPTVLEPAGNQRDRFANLNTPDEFVAFTKRR